MGLPFPFRSQKKASVLSSLMERPEIQEGLLFFSRERAWINDRHLTLCRIPAPTFLEQKRAEWMAGELSRLGCDVEIDRAGNVIAFTDRRSDRPYIAVTAHLDTVLAPRVDEDIRIGSDGRYLGPGIADNGAGLAGLLALAAAWQKISPAFEDAKYSLMLVANVGEEGEGNLSGMRYLCRQSPLSSYMRKFIVLDGPGTDHITANALGSKRYEIAYSGPGGHSWGDYGTPNPVHALANTIADFTASTRNPGGPKISINFGIIEGGASINSIPSEARTKLDIRSESPERMEELAELLTDVVERAVATENENAHQRSQGRVTARIREIGSRPGGRLPSTSPLLTALREVDSHLGIRAGIDCASTDANIPLSLGLPAVSIGAGGLGGGAHTSAEWYHPEGRETGLKRVFLLICWLLQQA